jgi:hypothetical protein
MCGREFLRCQDPVLASRSGASGQGSCGGEGRLTDYIAVRYTSAGKCLLRGMSGRGPVRPARVCRTPLSLTLGRVAASLHGPPAPEAAAPHSPASGAPRLLWLRRGLRAGYPRVPQEGHASVISEIAVPHIPQAGWSGSDRRSFASGSAAPQLQRTANATNTRPQDGQCLVMQSLRTTGCAGAAPGYPTHGRHGR